MTPQEVEQLKIYAKKIQEAIEAWRPLPGPQTMAYHSKADILFYGGAAGGGKLLSLDTPIPTINGWTTMGDIKQGDVIFDENGNTCNVVIVEPITTDITYLLKFSDGSEIVAGSSHRWLTETLADRQAIARRTGEYREKRRRNRPLRGLGKRPDLAIRNSQKKHVYLDAPAPTIKTTQEIVDTLYVRNRVNHSIPVCKPINLPPQNLLIDPYVLGAWLGDGTSKSGQITGLDVEIFDEIKKAGYVVTDHAEIKHKGILGLQTKLKALGVFGNKHIPVQYLRASVEQRLSLLQGLMDTDGHCDARGHCEFTNTNKTLIEHVHELVCSLGIKVAITEGVAKLNGNDYGAKYRLVFITDLPVFRLPRKLKRQKRDGFRGTHNRRYIIAAERIESIPMRCIAVDSPSHLYLAGKSFIPTHNTDLLLGLSHTAHWNTIIFRREFPQLKGIELRANELFGNPNRKLGDYNKSEKIWTFFDGRIIEFGAVQHLDSTEKYQGRPHDLVAFDEITHFLKEQFVFLQGWNRSAREGQRCRIICTGNPPTSADGDWVIDYWRPWLDDKHPNPAESGELRFFTTLDGEDVELESGEPFLHNGKLITPLSRTFIPAKIDDNPYLAKTNYRSVLQALPAHLRDKMLDGDFKAGRQDSDRQVIPTEWVERAQQRWRNRPKPQKPPFVIGIDVARGGNDKTVLTGRVGNYFFEQIAKPGIETKDGLSIVVIALTIPGISLETIINVDIIGVGGSPYDAFKMHKFKNVCAMNAAMSSEETDATKFLQFANKRAEWYWKLREALDPETGLELAIPDDRELKVELCAPRFEVRMEDIVIESKDEIKKRIGRSPDKADSLVLAFATGDKEIGFGSVRAN